MLSFMVNKDYQRLLHRVRQKFLSASCVAMNRAPVTPLLLRRVSIVNCCL